MSKNILRATIFVFWHVLKAVNFALDSNTPRGYTLFRMKKAIQSRALRRLKIIEGQVRGLQKMVATEQYCIDIITQSLAVKEALSGVEDLILENHLATHVVEQMKSGKGSRAAKEILAVYKLSKKK